MFIKKIDLDILNKRGENTMASHLGIIFTEIGSNYLVAKMPVDHRTHQPLGILNGGASVALAETVGSTAGNCCVDEQQYCVGLDINANHLRPVKNGYVHAKASPIHIGKKTQVWEITITDDNQKLTCISRLTLVVLDK